MFKEKQANKRSFSFDISKLVEAKKYVKPTDLLMGKKYPMRGYYKTKDNGYGEAFVIFSDTFLLDTSFNSFKYWDALISESHEMVESINGGKACFYIEEYQLEKFHNKGYRIVLDDAE